MYARIRTYYIRPNTFGENKKAPPGGQVSGWTYIHVEHVCKISGPSLIKRGGHIDFCAENMRILGMVACNYLVLV